MSRACGALRGYFSPFIRTAHNRTAPGRGAEQGGVATGAGARGGEAPPRVGDALRLVLDLRGEVEADVAELLDLVLDDERDVLREVEDDAGGERRRLREEVEVAQREVERHLRRGWGWG